MYPNITIAIRIILFQKKQMNIQIIQVHKIDLIITLMMLINNKTFKRNV